MMVVFDIALEGSESTHAAGRALGEVVAAGVSIGLSGDLGAGKTLLVQGLAAGLGVDDEAQVTSPTFSLVNEYPGGRALLVHADLYRIEAEGDLDQIGLRELCGAKGVVAAVEWYERFPSVFLDHLRVELTVSSATSRHLTVYADTPRLAALATAWHAAIHS